MKYNSKKNRKSKKSKKIKMNGGVIFCRDLTAKHKILDEKHKKLETTSMEKDAKRERERYGANCSRVRKKCIKITRHRGT